MNIRFSSLADRSLIVVSNWSRFGAPGAFHSKNNSRHLRVVILGDDLARVAGLHVEAHGAGLDAGDVEEVLDQFEELFTQSPPDTQERFAQLLAQLDRIPDRSDAADPLEWDEHGLPK